MRIFLVGGGGREHALAWKLAQSRGVTEIVAAPGNPGIATFARCLPLRATDVDRQVEAAREFAADLVVVGPDDPLALGIVDKLQAAGLTAFGPTQAAARIESSKAFAKQLMARAGIPTAAWRVVADLDSARREIAAMFAAGAARLVVKADGLALGKGVVIARSAEEAVRAAAGMLSGEWFGASGKRVVLEEFLDGTEVSVLALVDGRNALLLPPARDHKQAYDGDAGPNTGGMGTISPAPRCDEAMVERIRREVIEPAVAAMAESGAPFRGCLFAGLMLTAAGPRVLEFNARFGDPEAQSVLRRIDADLADLFMAAATGDLAGRKIPVGAGAAATVVMASAGYPGKYDTGRPIEGIDAAEGEPGVVVFHAGTARDGAGRLVTAGGRVLGVSAAGPDLAEAVAAAYRGVERIRFEGAHYRRDIGRR